VSRFEAASSIYSQSSSEQRLHIENLIDPTAIATSRLTEGKDAIAGLTQTPKTLPPRYFYDDRGSQLFEQICELPEYYLTRTETAILQRYATEIARLTGACELVELGSGSSTKTRLLLDAHKNLGYPLHYVPVDVSAGILESSARQLLTDYSTLKVRAIASTYELALERLVPTQLPSRTICFIGSTLGNLTPSESDEFFARIFAALEVGEYFLLGVDLQKSKSILEAAYNDRQGVTAAFNLNMLQHLNWRYDSNFNLQNFEHYAFYNKTEHQIEMHLRSWRSQTVQMRSLDLTIEFAAQETIRTEISRKFNLKTLQQQLQAQGLIPIKTWTDPKQWFGLLLCQKRE
jgi:dimethylhistidine N-methyltransferase